MKTKLAATGGATQTFVDDVFSTYLYNGNGSTQTITNGIDLAGKGGLVWTKARSAAYDHILVDTVRGRPNSLHSNTTSAQLTRSDISSFNSDGYSLGLNQGYENNGGINYASWTFREQPKFFDIVTYTGNGAASQTINHGLGSVVGCMIVKGISGSTNWAVYHRSMDASSQNFYMILDGTTSKTDAVANWGNTAPTSTQFTVGDNNNANGLTYVAYLFAHDTSSTGIIQCGSFTTDGSGNATVNLGWEPQFLLRKVATDVGNWNMWDTMRGFTASNSVQTLVPNLSNAEFTSSGISINSTGFIVSGFTPSVTAIYMAIRRSNKPPTTGTQVYQGVVTGSTNFPYVITNTVVDFAIRRANKATTQSYTASSRLTGDSYLLTTTSDAETAGGGTFTFDSMSGWYNTSLSETPVVWNFKRASGFFDVVCYTGTGSATTQAHNLTVVPELMIVKSRSNALDWSVYVSSLTPAQYLMLNNTAPSLSNTAFWNNTTPTSTVFSIGAQIAVNYSSYTYVAYLFATLAGISKVGSYTGNGTGQVIACGFSAGARFVLIKRTDDAGNWYTFDSARGLTSGSSPYLLLNNTAAEVTGNNGVYASTGGFTLGSTASTTTNINGASYIYLSVA